MTTLKTAKLTLLAATLSLSAIGQSVASEQTQQGSPENYSQAVGFGSGVVAGAPVGGAYRSFYRWIYRSLNWTK